MFLRICVVILVFSSCAFGQVERPKLNSLEARKGREISAALVRTSQELTERRDAFVAVGKWTAPRPKSEAELERVRPKKAAADKEWVAKAAAADKARIAKATADHERQLAQARDQISRADQQINDLNEQLRGWEASVLESHKGDGVKHHVDWQTGEVKPGKRN